MTIPTPPATVEEQQAVGPVPAKKTTLPETTEGLPWLSSHEIKKESNPFTDRDPRMFAYAWFGMMVRVFLVVGGVFSVYQFLLARDEKKVERSLELVQLWETPTYQAAERAVKQRLKAFTAANPELLGGASAAEKVFLTRKIGIGLLTADGGAMPLPEFEEHFDRIVYFLNRVAFCVDRGLCADDVADAYFKDYAVSWWSVFAGYVEARRGASPNYAVPIETYVSRPSSADTVAANP